MQPDPINIWSSVPDDLIARAADCDPSSVADIARLRKKFSADHVRAALDLTLARRKAQNKFPKKIVNKFLALPQAVEQASSYRAAKYKATRFKTCFDKDAHPSIPENRIIDLCCGIGGDALALSQILPSPDQLLAVDIDPLRTWMCKQNTGVQTLVTDITTPTFKQTLSNFDCYHIDPARRTTAGQRLWQLADIIPSPDYLAELVSLIPTGCTKLSPAINHDELSFPAEVEYLSEAGSLTQALAWTGKLAHNTSYTTATLLTKDNQTHTLTDQPTDVSSADCSSEKEYLFTIDPSVERARLIPHLASTLNLDIIHPKLGLLTSNTLSPADQSPFLKPYRLIAYMPWKESRIKNWLASHDAAIITIKTRDKTVNPDHLAPALRGTGNIPYTLFILRKNKSIITYITEPL
ncbi:THUMP-like domain-containing protein [Poriferisphaera sp. WC338]|uniref:THUMP-like domain-containing protein n=1 Tax=Poriferisphaera sp. WC338 TaxID=3425129 RepID=UPI003D8189A0